MIGKKYIFTGEGVNVTSDFIVGKIYEAVGNLDDYGAFVNERGEKDGYLSANNRCFKEVTKDHKQKITDWPFSSWALTSLILISITCQGQDSYSARKDSSEIKHKSERRERRKDFIKKLPSIVFTGIHSIYYIRPRRWY